MSRIKETWTTCVHQVPLDGEQSNMKFLPGSHLGHKEPQPCHQAAEPGEGDKCDCTQNNQARNDTNHQFLHLMKTQTATFMHKNPLKYLRICIYIEKMYLCRDFKYVPQAKKTNRKLFSLKSCLLPAVRRSSTELMFTEQLSDMKCLISSAHCSREQHRLQPIVSASHCSNSFPSGQSDEETQNSD